MNIKSVSGAMFAGMITQLVSAPALSAVVYPSKIQACIASAVCNDPTLVQQESTFSAYSYLDGGAAKYLFEYNLSPSSNESTNFSSTQLSGAAWLSANAVYDLSADLHNFTLYLDGVTPSPTDLTVGDSNGLDLELSMSTADLLTGNSFLHWGEEPFGGVFHEGDLNNGALPCLAFGCEIGAEFNLLNMQYQQSGTSALLILNPTDQRAILYSQYQDYFFDDTFYRSQSYVVVPIPPAVWLFGSGFIWLFGLKEYKART